MRYNKSRNYNLLVEPWIPILWTNGRGGRVGIREALIQSRYIRQIASTNQMDNVAVLRLLLAVLQWCKPTLDDAERDTLFKGDGIPEHWVSDRLGADAQPCPSFAMLAKNDGFLQDQSAWKELIDMESSDRSTTPEKIGYRPATDLLQELPSGTSVAHFRHTRDRENGLCPGCCAMGLVRLCAFASASAHGKKAQKPAGINGSSPVYISASAESLLGEFLLNWPMRSVKGDAPWWEDPDEPTSSNSIGPQRAFTWQPRRTWLERPKEWQSHERCCACGQETLLVYKIAFFPGWKRPFAKKAWPDDPHLLTVLSRGKKKGQASVEPISLPNAAKRVDEFARSWRTTARAVLQRQMAASIQTQGTSVFCAGPAANKALYQDVSSCAVRAPLGSNRALQELQWLDDIDLHDFLLKAFPRNALQRPEVSSALTVFSADMENALRKQFDHLLGTLANAESCADAEDQVRQWFETVQAILREVLHRSCALIDPGTPLRRRENVRRAWKALNESMAERAGGK